MSTYNLNNDSIPEYLVRIIAEIQQILKERAYDFILVGAAARDVIMTAVHGKRPGRLTRDIDFALYIPEWDSYTTIMNELINSGKFTPTNLTHRLVYNGTHEIDIVPFGDIQNEDGQYTWPPDNIKSMTVAGFHEVSEHGININITDSELHFRVASIPGIGIMKLFAWKDRKNFNYKDGKDLGFIIANYIELKWDTMYDEYTDIVDDPSFDAVSSAARILGREIFQLINKNPVALKAIKEILQKEVNDPENSHLAIAMHQGGISSYNLAFKSLKQLLNGIQDGI